MDGKPEKLELFPGFFAFDGGILSPEIEIFKLFPTDFEFSRPTEKPICAQTSFICAEINFICAMESLICGIESFICGMGKLICATESLVCAMEEFISAIESFMCAMEEPSGAMEKPDCNDSYSTGGINSLLVTEQRARDGDERSGPRRLMFKAASYFDRLRRILLRQGAEYTRQVEFVHRAAMQ